jgi:glycosyltransferase involved in cell wall biosynthesis
MRVSIVIPVYGRQTLGVRALRSARSQDVEGMEIVVVDDASDPPFQLPADLTVDPRIRVVRHNENRGAGRARDTGVAAAQGAWIAFLDSDDYWLPGTLAPRLELAERAFAATRDPMVAYAAGFVLDRRTDNGQHQETRIPLPSADIEDFLSGCWFAHGSTALLRREAFARVGETDPALRRFEDYDWFVRFALAGGRLEVWPHVAAIIEVTKKPRVAAVEDVVAHLRAKYTDPHGPYRLAPKAINRLESCFDFELASSLSADKRWLETLVHLTRSFWRVPRTTLHLRRLWKNP